MENSRWKKYIYMKTLCTAFHFLPPPFNEIETTQEHMVFFSPHSFFFAFCTLMERELIIDLSDCFYKSSYKHHTWLVLRQILYPPGQPDISSQFYNHHNSLFYGHATTDLCLSTGKNKRQMYIFILGTTFHLLYSFKYCPHPCWSLKKFTLLIGINLLREVLVYIRKWSWKK